jgi:excinuclease ABC subunit A
MSEVKKIKSNKKIINADPPQIFIKGARVHNLKNIDVALPKNKFIVITGCRVPGKVH